MQSVQEQVLTNAGLRWVAGDPELIDLSRVMIYERCTDPIEPGTFVLLPALNRDDAQAAVRDAEDRGAAGVALRESADEAGQMVDTSTLTVAVFVRPSKSSLVDTYRAIITSTLSPSNLPVEISGESDMLNLAESLASLLGGPVIIEDADLNVLSYSTHIGSFDAGRDLTILGRRTSASWREYMEQSGILATLRTSDEIIDVPNGPQDSRRRLIAPLRERGEFLGLLWLAEGEHALREDITLLLAQAARVVALHVKGFHAHRRSRLDVTKALVRDLLEGLPVSHASVEQIGLDPSLPCVLIGVRSTHGMLDERAQRIVEALGSYCMAYRRKGAACTIGQTVYLVVSVRRGIDYVSLLDTLGNGVLEVCKRSARTEVIGVMSNCVDKRNQLPQTRERVDKAIEVLERRAPADSSGMHLYRDMQADMAIEIACDAVLDSRLLDLRSVGLLDLFDDSDGNKYGGTLWLYLKHQGNVRLVAEDLGIHGTTVRYRLNAIRKLTSLDLDDPMTLLLLSLIGRRFEQRNSDQAA